jgi:hypothetical protein
MASLKTVIGAGLAGLLTLIICADSSASGRRGCHRCRPSCCQPTCGQPSCCQPGRGSDARENFPCPQGYTTVSCKDNGQGGGLVWTYDSSSSAQGCIRNEFVGQRCGSLPCHCGVGPFPLHPIVCDNGHWRPAQPLEEPDMWVCNACFHYFVDNGGAPCYLHPMRKR